MSKVLIYIEGMKLRKIDAYCAEKGISRSKLFTRGALSIVHAQPLPKCEIVFCKNPSMGKFEITVYDWQDGEKKETKSLCEFHRKKAATEGEVKELD